VDNFCWPTIQYDPADNPDGKYKAAQLVRANWALRDCCLGYGIPLLSGKDSMYVDGNLEGPYGEKRKISGLPTLMFTVSSIIEDVAKCVTMDARFPGDLVYVLGETRNELGGGEFYEMLGATGLNVPKVDIPRFWPHYLALHRAVREELVTSCHAVARGGLAVHLALAAMAGEVGIEVDLQQIPASPGLTGSRLMFSESCGRFLLTVAPEKKDDFEKLFAGLSLGCVGAVSETPVLRLADGEGKPVMEENIELLKAAWQRPFGDLI
jgi:phosphoribosylformylglycinamidine synthase